MSRLLLALAPLAGLAATALALAWWAVVFGRVVDGGYMSYAQAAPCALRTDDLCSLAQALCGGDHLFGIRRYSAGLLWVGLVLTAAGGGFFLLAGRPRVS